MLFPSLIALLGVFMVVGMVSEAVDTLVVLLLNILKIDILYLKREKTPVGKESKTTLHYTMHGKKF